MGCVCLQKRLQNIRDTVCCACCTYSSPTFAAQRQPLASFAVCLCGCQEVAELHSGQLGSATATKHSLLTSLPTLRLSLSWFQRAAGLICEGSAESGQNKLQRESQQQAKSASKPHRPNRKQLHAFKQPETPKKHRPNQTPGLWGKLQPIRYNEFRRIVVMLCIFLQLRLRSIPYPTCRQWGAATEIFALAVLLILSFDQLCYLGFTATTKTSYGET